ncbi:hypothetical protein ACSAMZ_13760 [Xanthomonas citri pv. bilvae]|uniref:hypothetical protein n=1 Tax=Xanthomonas citri TaxID=346 RepID=UPI00406A463E
MRHQLAHHRQLQQGLLEGVDAGFGGEQGVEVLGQALPALCKVIGIAGLGQTAQQRLHQLGMGAVGIGLPGFQPVAQGHQLIDFGDDAVLFGERRQSNNRL